MKERHHNKILNAAGALLIVIIMVLSATTAIAVNTNSFGNMNNVGPVKPEKLEYKAGSLFLQPPNLPDDTFWAFMTSSVQGGYIGYEKYWDVNQPIGSIHWWGTTLYIAGGVWNVGSPVGMRFNITFCNEDWAGRPGSPVVNYSDVTTTYVDTGITYDGVPCYYWSASLNPPVVNLSSAWISIQSIYSPTSPPSWFLWLSSSVGDGISFQGINPNQWDLSLNLTLPDTNPPVTTCHLAGTMNGSIYVSNVTVGLTATDADSGVDYTLFKLNDGDWTTYTAPFIISEDGTYNLSFKSVDFAGNWETEKNISFTVQHPPAFEITISSGKGLNVSINNSGWKTMQFIPWSINITGGIIFIGKSKTGQILQLKPGENWIIKFPVFGFGRTTITVAVGDVEQTAKRFVFLSYVLLTI
ncbi:MAG TPA: hypothetical protein VN377_03820 [Candidatus Thermoplasmatota archaeon]|nr:hypothetical protein [Candidatus Thermoplasmatota archaeon]